MKRFYIITALLFAVALILSLAACGASVTAAPTSAPETSAAPTEVPAPTETPAPTEPPETAPLETPVPATPEPTLPPVETAAPEQPAPPEKTPEIMTPGELSDWVDSQEGDLSSLLAGLQNIQIDLSYEPDETDVIIYELPHEYDFLLPDGLREGDFVRVMSDGYNLFLNDRTTEDFEELVRLADAAGYGGLSLPSSLGILQYEGELNGYCLEIMYSAGTIIVARGLPE